jgi:hypothetical protein
MCIQGRTGSPKPFFVVMMAMAILTKTIPTNQTVLFNCQEEFGKELALILDVRTCWNSVLEMLERFYQVINAIRKSLIYLKSDTKSDEQLLTDIIAALQPIKAAVEQLCCGEANLFTAGVTMRFMLNELVEQNNDLSIALKNVLIFRITAVAYLAWYRLPLEKRNGRIWFSILFSFVFVSFSM